MKTVLTLLLLLECISHAHAQGGSARSASSTATIVARCSSGSKIVVVHSASGSIGSDMIKGGPIHNRNEGVYLGPFLREYNLLVESSFEKNIHVALSSAQESQSMSLHLAPQVSIDGSNLKDILLKRQGTILVSVMSPDASSIQGGAYFKSVDVVVAYN